MFRVALDLQVEFCLLNEFAEAWASMHGLLAVAILIIMHQDLLTSMKSNSPPETLRLSSALL